MNLEKIIHSKIFIFLPWILLFLIIILLTFKAGMSIGLRKADFSGNWGENYHQNFAGPKGGFMQDMWQDEYLEANGAFGQIIKIENNNLIVKNKSNIEKIILVTENTIIKNLKNDIKIENLNIDDFIVVIGEPNNDGQIEAKLIRKMPEPKEMPKPKNLNFIPKRLF